MKTALTSVLLALVAVTTQWQIGQRNFTPIASSVSGSWQYKVDGNYTALGTAPSASCNSTTSLTCTFSIPPTTANSAFNIYIYTVNNVTISSAAWNGTSCGGAWSYPANAQNTDTSNASYMQTAINQGNTGGCTSVTLTFSGDHGGAQPLSLEGIPPVGATAVYDTASNATNSSCDTACTAPSFTLGGTDFVSYYANTRYTVSGSGFVTGYGSYSGCGSPYLEDYAAACYALNQTGTLSGTFSQCGTGVGCSTAGFADAVGVAWKASSSFTVTPSAIWSLVNGALGANTTTGVSLSSTSTNVTIASTAGGGDGFVWVAISATAGNELTGCNVGSTSGSMVSGFTGSLSGIGAVSLCFVASEPSGQTTGSVTANNSGTYYLGGYEIGKSSGTVALDCSNSTTVTTAANSLTGPTCSVSGSDDLAISAIVISGGGTSNNECVQSDAYYSIPYLPTTNCTGQVYFATGTIGSVGIALNQTSAPAAVYTLYDNTTSEAAVSVAAFK